MSFLRKLRFQAGFLLLIVVSVCVNALAQVEAAFSGFERHHPRPDGGAIAGVVARYGGKPRQIVWAGRLAF